MAWLLARGDIEDGLHVLHRCDNPPCCNPAHLFLGTNVDNIGDRVAKGRSNPHKKLSDEQVNEVLSRKGLATCRQLASEYGVSPSLINYIHSGKKRVKSCAA